MRWRVFVVVFVVGSSMVMAPFAQANKPRKPDRSWSGAVYDIEDRTTIPDSTAKVLFFVEDEPAGPFPTSTSHIEFRLETSQLVAGHAYTVWLIVFNHPENCATPGACTDQDLTNPAAVASVMWGTGGVATDGRTAEFRGTRRQGDLDRVIFGPGLSNTAGADVRMVVRDHGPHDEPHYGKRQTQTFNGGCPDGNGNDPGSAFDNTLAQNRCQDVQST